MATDIREVSIARTLRLDAYRTLSFIENDIEVLLQLGSRVGGELGTRRVWMLSAREHGDASTEMIPSLCRLLNEIGVDARWIVLDSDERDFFAFGRDLNLRLNGLPAPAITDRQAVYDRMSEEVAGLLQGMLDPRDILIVHGVTLAGVVQALPAAYHSRAFWRCLIGHQGKNGALEAWKFLEPYLEPYAKLFFSEQRFIPPFLRGRASVVTPGLDPLSHKNRDLRPNKLMGILRSAGLLERPSAPAWAAFERQVLVLRNNDWKPTPIPALVHKPFALQVSRFDKLKGFHLVLDAFAKLLKSYPEKLARLPVDHERAKSELDNLELVLAGPDPCDCPADIEAEGVLKELTQLHSSLPPDVAKRIHILRLPIANRKENALVVNALQRLAAVVVQASQRQGFGLSVTEALWKGAPVVATNVGGIGLQVRPGIDGTLIDEPVDTDVLANALIEVIAVRRAAEAMSRSGHKRVEENFLVFQQLRDLLQECHEVLTSSGALRPRPVSPASERRQPASVRSAGQRE